MLFLCRKSGRTVAHNLTPPEVYEMRLGDDAEFLTFHLQERPHQHCGNPAFCPECAEYIAGLREKQKEQQIALWEKGFPLSFSMLLAKISH
jgi:hypothetical protein